jgi:hypothetical protein
MFIFFHRLSILFFSHMIIKKQIKKTEDKERERKHKYNTDNFLRWATDGEIKKRE